MLQRLPLSLRTWSGALLVCALFACLSGLARPAMAMAMPGPMDMPAQVMAVGHAGAEIVAEVPGHGSGCPVATEQCVAPKGVPAQDSPAAPVPMVESRLMSCAPALLAARPKAPPSSADPPDLYRLCVSRT
ncbi:hypothetical protein OHA37_09150 [Streptomyces sp. NBC_00335]|uniref:hypothetical protein n=1 Tax=unclassified Streptomyces TaxID=2593676 RepID=UPI00225A5FC4|nr:MULTISPECIES: hypothetical protein [unclassified Streptomyces]MCX5404050.1 hypothetical protein [Streptomyces sp. NBC_00086]